MSHSQLPFFPQCIVVPRVPPLSDTDTCGMCVCVCTHGLWSPCHAGLLLNSFRPSLFVQVEFSSICGMDLAEFLLQMESVSREMHKSASINTMSMSSPPYQGWKDKKTFQCRRSHCACPTERQVADDKRRSWPAVIYSLLSTCKCIL